MSSWEAEMPRALPEAERWEDPIVEEVRKTREKLFAAAGYNLEEFCRRLSDLQGGPLRVSKQSRPEVVRRPNKSSQRPRGKSARR